MAARKQPTGWVQYVAPPRPSFLRRKVASSYEPTHLGFPGCPPRALSAKGGSWGSLVGAPHPGIVCELWGKLLRLGSEGPAFRGGPFSSTLKQSLFTLDHLLIILHIHGLIHSRRLLIHFFMRIDLVDMQQGSANII